METKLNNVPKPPVRRKKVELICSNPKTTSTFVYTLLKKVTVVCVIYCVGYLNWSISWLITSIILAETRDYLMETNNVVRRKIAKASALGGEKEILACVKDLPSWVYFPDYERCEWVNQIMQQMWPYIDEFFSINIIINKYEPKIRKALAKKKLHGFEFDRNRILLGTTPLRIGGIKVHDLNTSRDEIIFDIDLIFASECSIHFRLAGIPAALNDFEIYGKIRVVLRPLITKAPFIGAVQVFFLNNPDINFNLAGPAEISNIPGLNDILRRIIAKKIAKKMVSPNKITKKLSKEMSLATVKMHEPEGLLRIHVAEARNLIKQDITLLGGKSDPYVVVTIGAQQFRTPTIHDNLNPIWDYWCEAFIDTNSEIPIQFHAFDWDRTGGNDPLGNATVDFKEILKNGIMDTWLRLEGVEHGDLHVRFAWYELSTSPSNLPTALEDVHNLGIPKMSTAVLCLYIDSATDLPQIHPEDKPDPFAKIAVSNSERLTSVRHETDNPVWEQAFTFLLTNPEHDTLQIQIIGQKSSKKCGDNLGQFSYNISNLLLQNDLKSVLQAFELKKSGATSKVKMSMALKILKRYGTQTLRPIFFPKNLKLHKQSSQTESLTSEDEVVKERPKLRDLRQLSFESSRGLGRIKLGFRYNSKHHVLSVIVHKIINIPIKDPSYVPDPYVIIYLLPKRSKEFKRKTIVVKNSCDPVFETNFEFGSITPNELKMKELEVTVKSKLPFLSGGSLTLGMVKISFADKDIIDKETTEFYDLLKEVKLDGCTKIL